MAHPQTRVAPLVGVGRGPTPVLDQEQTEPLPRTGKVVLVGVERQQGGVRLDVVVEVIDELYEEVVAADRVVERGLGGAARGSERTDGHGPDATAPIRSYL